MDNSIVGKFIKFSDGMRSSDALKTGMGNFFSWLKNGSSRAPTGDLAIDGRGPVVADMQGDMASTMVEKAAEAGAY